MSLDSIFLAAVGVLFAVKLAIHIRRKMQLTTAKSTRQIIQGVVENITRDGMEVTVYGQRCFCPFEERPKRLDYSLIGQRLSFTVISYRNNNAILRRYP